MIKFKCKCTW